MPCIRDPAVQLAIADAYIENGGNKEQAVIAAGYSERYARGNASKLVAISGVQEKISARNRELEQSRIADMAEINSFWSDTMRNAKYDIKDRLKASELRARAAGGFVDKGEHSVELKVKNPFAELTTEELRRLAGDE